MKSLNKRNIITAVVPVLIGLLFAWAGSQHGAKLGSFPLFAAAVALAFLVQWAVYIPSQITKSEKFFDLTGSVTYAGITLALWLLSPHKHVGTTVLAALVMIWSLRLGIFLFRRIHRVGKDDRFDEIKKDPLRFFGVWNVQALWVTITASAAWIAITADHKKTPAFATTFLVAGLALWCLGFGCEVTADNQKNAFKANPANKGKFIHTGIWSRSQHPNYFGEITMWVGILIAALPYLHGWQYIGITSPVFVAFLLTKVSGIPLLEAKAQEKWGNDPEYQEYIAQTPVLIPRISAK